MVRPGGATAPIALIPSADETHWSYADTDLGGTYALRDASQGELKQFAVNVDTTESDLAKIDPQRLPRDIEIRTTAGGPADESASEFVSQAGYSGHLLWSAFALLLLELFLAWQFGRGTA
jgi:hypothetical protein